MNIGRSTSSVAMVMALVGLAVIGFPAAASARGVDSQVGARCASIEATIVGTDKADTIHGTEGPDVIAAGGGSDVVFGEGGNDLICGGGQDDNLFGGAGDDHLYGQGDRFVYDEPRYWLGDDLAGGPGNDIFEGGDGKGADELTYAASPQAIRVELATRSVTGEGHDTVSTDVERISGSAFGDVMLGSAGGDHLYGSLGDDRILGLGGNDTLSGSAGNDELRGGRGNNSMYGSDGDDFMRAAGGSRMFGEEGDDVLIGSPETDNLYGDTTCCAPRSGGDDTIKGGLGSDYISSYWGDDVVDGGPGNDKIEDNAGLDHILGGVGDDSIRASDPEDGSYFNGGDGSDQYMAGAFEPFVVDLRDGRMSEPAKGTVLSFEEVWGSYIEDDVIIGTDVDEAFYTFNGDDRVEAHGGDDEIYTYDGDDYLDGGDGDDIADADTGTDVCIAIEQSIGCESEPKGRL